jgi:lysine 2,3-aminomutase
MVTEIEDMRTPLPEIIAFDKELQRTLPGRDMSSFVADLSGGGGKRLGSTYEADDRKIGVASYRAPGLSGAKSQQLYY